MSQKKISYLAFTTHPVLDYFDIKSNFEDLNLKYITIDSEE